MSLAFDIRQTPKALDLEEIEQVLCSIMVYELSHGLRGDCTGPL